MSAPRECGACSLCCTVLRVDELRKLGGTPCVHQRAGGGCGIYETPAGHLPRLSLPLARRRPARRRSPRRARGGARRRLAGASVWLEIREAQPGAFERSPRLREIAQEYRVSMPVRIGDTADVLDPERRFRVLLPNGEERVVAGEWTTLVRPGLPDTQPASALARALAAAALAGLPAPPRRELPRRALSDESSATRRREQRLERLQIRFTARSSSAEISVRRTPGDSSTNTAGTGSCRYAGEALRGSCRADGSARGSEARDEPAPLRLLDEPPVGEVAQTARIGRGIHQPVNEVPQQRRSESHRRCRRNGCSLSVVRSW